MNERLMYYISKSKLFLLALFIFLLTWLFVKDWRSTSYFTELFDFKAYLQFQWEHVLLFALILTVIMWLAVNQISRLMMVRIKKRNEEKRELSEIRNMRLGVNR